jgi:hypothetical protein
VGNLVLATNYAECYPSLEDKSWSAFHWPLPSVKYIQSTSYTLTLIIYFNINPHLWLGLLSCLLPPDIRSVFIYICHAAAYHVHLHHLDSISLIICGEVCTLRSSSLQNSLQSAVTSSRILQQRILNIKYEAPHRGMFSSLLVLLHCRVEKPPSAASS